MASEPTEAAMREAEKIVGIDHDGDNMMVGNCCYDMSIHLSDVVDELHELFALALDAARQAGREQRAIEPTETAVMQAEKLYLSIVGGNPTWTRERIALGQPQIQAILSFGDEQRRKGMEEAEKVAEKYAQRMYTAAANNIRKGKPSTVAECKLDAAKSIAAAIRALREAGNVKTNREEMS